MKNRFFATSAIPFAILISGILFLPSCKKGFAFGMDYSADFTINSAVLVNVPVDLPTPDITTNSEQEFENHDTKAKWIEFVAIEGLVLTIQNPPSKTFSFLKSVHLFISSPGIPEQEVAWADSVSPSAGATLALNTSGVDLSDFIKAETFSLRAQVVTDETLLQSVDVTADMDFSVSAFSR